MSIQYPATFLIAAVAGFCQSVTGFGGAIMLMLVLPDFFPFQMAPTISNAVTAPLSTSIFIKNRKHVNLKKILLPGISYLVACTIAIRALGGLNLQGLKIAFGSFLVILSVYFFFISERVRISPTPLAAILCGAIAGTTGGLFGIGGPPLVLYFLAATRSREEYLGSCNGVFCITVFWQLIMRICSGLVPEHWFLSIVFGIAGVMLGRWIGMKVSGKLNDKVLKKVIYAFLAVSGILQLI